MESSKRLNYLQILCSFIKFQICLGREWYLAFLKFYFSFIVDIHYFQVQHRKGVVSTLIFVLNNL